MWPIRLYINMQALGFLFDIWHHKNIDTTHGSWRSKITSPYVPRSLRQRYIPVWLLALDPWDSLQKVWKRPEVIVCLWLAFKFSALTPTLSYGASWVQKSNTLEHSFKGHCTSCLFWGDGLSMSLDHPQQECIHIVVVAQPEGQGPPVVSTWFPPQIFSLHKFATINS